MDNITDNIALIICSKKEPEPSRWARIWKKLIRWLKDLFKKPDIQQWIKKMELYDRMNLCLIKLPYSIDELTGFKDWKKDKIKAHIAQLCADVSVQTCIPAKELRNILLPVENCPKFEFSGRLLFKALAMRIIEEVFDQKNIEVRKLDLAIIAGNSPQELLALINMVDLILYTDVSRLSFNLPA